ncbi:MAG: hypothetical protein KGH68_03050 [Patescibacteria group bacterium]|nr:hypothetical protein [Patescibacteria group bacterium]
MDEDFKKKYDRLPADVRSAIESNDVASRLEKIGEKHGLHIDQIGTLEQTVGSVMMGDIHPDDFVGEISDTLDLSDEDAVALATDVNTEIFLPVRESLIKVHSDRPDDTPPVQTPGLVMEKLSGTVSVPPQTVTVPSAQPQQDAKPKTYAADPYREPLA